MNADKFFREIVLDATDITVKYHMFENDYHNNFTIYKDGESHTITITNINDAWMFSKVIITYNPKDIYEILDIRYFYKMGVCRKKFNNRLSFESFVVDLFDILSEVINSTTNFKLIINTKRDIIEVEAWNDISKDKPVFMEKMGLRPFDLVM